MDRNHQLMTPAVDLMTPSDRFASTSRLHGRLHRSQLLLRKNWWLIVLIFLCMLGPAYFYSVESPPAYQSKARLWLTGRLNISESRIYTEELINYLGTQSELLSSGAVYQRALAKLRTTFTNALSASTGSKLGFRPIQTVKEIVKTMAGMSLTSTNSTADSPFTLKVAESSKSSILELRATGPEPAITRAFLNYVIEEYFAFKKENRARAADTTLASVTGEIRQLSAEIKAQQEKLHAFESSNNVVILQQQGSSAGSYLGQLNRQISTLRTELHLLQTIDPEQWIEAANRRANTGSGEPAEAAAREALASTAGSQADLFRANQQRQLLISRRDELLRFLRPQHPKIIKLNEDIATQEKLVKISRDEAARQLANRRQSLQLELTNLASTFAEWEIKAADSSRKVADSDRMRLELQRLQTAYDRLLGVMQSVDVGRTVDQENVGILEGASVAVPDRRMIKLMLLAFVAASMLSLGTLYCLGMMDDRFASVTELYNHFSEEVLGQIPSISIKNPKGQLGAQFLERQKFEFLESFRNIRSSLMFMNTQPTRPKTILLTSSVPKEGKSTVSLYLAATLALGNARVLLVDADMRRASLHKFFAVKSRPGLAEILSREVSPAASIIPSSMENLSFLPAGMARRNPGELVLSPEWTRFISEVSSQFDYILVDSPPLLATDDAASLAPKVDGVVMIVRGSYTSARVARRALEMLRQRKAQVLGLIFNRALASASESHYYQPYEKRYRWESSSAVRVPELVAGTVEQTRNGT